MFETCTYLLVYNRLKIGHCERKRPLLTHVRDGHDRKCNKELITQPVTCSKLGSQDW